MHEKPLVSVLIPFYNTAPRFLQEALESVLAQTYLHWEILLVDDGSREESSACALHYVETYPPKIRYLEHPGHQNHGISLSRRLGFSHARGSYLCLLDADDYWLPHKLEEQVALMQAYPEVGMLTGKTLYWHSWTGLEEDQERDAMPSLGSATNKMMPPPRYLELLLDRKTSVPCQCSIMVRREVVKQVGGFDELQNMYEDQRFYARVALATSVLAQDACWDWYRQHPASVSAVSRAAGEVNALHLDYLDWLANYLMEQEITDAGIWRALRRQQWLGRLPTQGVLPTPITNLLRLVKKRLLKVEERVLPDALRNRLWSQ